MIRSNGSLPDKRDTGGGLFFLPVFVFSKLRPHALMPSVVIVLVNHKFGNISYTCHNI